MERRAVLIVCSASLAAAATRSFSQAPKEVRRIAFVHPSREVGYRVQFGAFRSALRDLGYVEGRNISIESTWGDDQFDRIPAIAASVVASKPDVIVTATSAAVAAFKKLTSSIPIVFATAGSPVEQGFVASLRRPGGNITGVLVYSGLTSKLVEVARQALPGAKSIALLIHGSDPAKKLELAGFEEAAARFKFKSLIVGVSGPEEFDRAFAELAKRKVDALIVPQLAMFFSHAAVLADLATKAKLPLLSPVLTLAEAGGLLSYGNLREESFRRAAALVDKILRGANPGDLAVEQPERFELVVNMKTAKAIGVKLSPNTLLRVTKVIE